MEALETRTPLCAELKKQASQEQHCVSMQTSPTADLKAVAASILVDRAVQLSPNPVFEPAQRDRMHILVHVFTSSKCINVRVLYSNLSTLVPFS